MVDTKADTKGQQKGLAALRQRVAQRLARTTSGDVWTAIVLAVPVAVLSYLILFVGHIPMVDYPEHAATVAALHGSGKPAFDSFFVNDLIRSQYLVFYVMGDWLSYLFSVDLASRLTMLFGFVMLPISVAAFLSAHHRPPMLGALAAAVVPTMFFFWGFIQFMTGIWPAVLALAVLAHLSRRPTWGRAALFGLLAVVTFYSHAQMYAWLVVASFIQVIAMIPEVGLRTSVAAAIRAFVAAIPSAIALFVWLRVSSFIERGEAGDRTGLVASVTDQPPTFDPIGQTLRTWLDQSFAVYADGSGERIAVAFVAVVVLIIILRGARKSPFAPERTSLAPELILATTLLLWLFAPNTYKVVSPINQRFFPVALALLGVLGPLELRGFKRSALVGAALIALTLFAGSVHREKFIEMDAEFERLDEVVAQAEPGHALIGLMYDRGSGVIPLPLHLHDHQYYQSNVGGFAAYSFIEFPKSPVQYRPGHEPPIFPARFEWTPERFDWNIWGNYFDYYLLRVRPGQEPPSVFMRGAPPDLQMVTRSERWILFRKPNGR